MFKSAGLIPTRFLVLIAHFTICVNLLWNGSPKFCLQESQSGPNNRHHLIELKIGLCVTLGLVCLEFLAFILGLTMFNVTSALLSVFGHALGSLCTTLLVIDRWKCGWFWWIFALSSVTPVLYDLYFVAYVLYKRKWDISISHPTWTRLLLLTGLVTILGGSTPVGYHIGVINTPRPIIQVFLNASFHAHYNLDLSQLQLDTIYSIIVAVFLVGGTIGSFSGSLLADKIGRKGGMVVASIIGVVSGLMFGAAKWAMELLVVGRFFAGLSAGLITAIMPMYLMELAPARLKGAVGAFCPLGVTVGVLLGQVLSMRGILGNESSWPICLACPAVLQAICALLVLVLPESPKFLFVIKKKPHLALEQLKRLRNLGEESVSDEINFLKMEEQENLRQGDTWNIKKVLKSKSLSLPLLLMCFLQAGQQLSGVNAVFYYSSIIFQRAGLSVTSSEFATIGTGLCNIFMALVSVQTMSWFRRRIILQLSLITTIFMLCLLGLSLLLINKVTWMPYLCIMAVLGYVLCYGLGLGPIPYFIGSELFEVGPRSSAMALGSMANWAGNFVVGLTFPLMDKALGAWSFFIFAGFTIWLLTFIRFYFPETKGKDACDIARLVNQGFKSKPLEPSVANRTQELANLTDKTHL